MRGLANHGRDEILCWAGQESGVGNPVHLAVLLGVLNCLGQDVHTLQVA